MSKDRKKLLHIHSSVNDKQPTPATLELGELGVNNAKGNAFISTKNSDGEVVRFSEDETIIGWMEQKEVFPYEGYMRGADNSQVSGVTEQDLLDNKSNLIIKLNQVVPENTDYSPYDEKVNGAKDIYGNLINPISSGGYKDGAGLAIDMSKYAMIGANPSFSSITTTCHATLNGTTEIKGKGDGCGSKFTVEVANACIDATDTLNEYGVNHSNFGTSCDGTKISNDTTLKGKKIFIDSPSGDLTVDIQACNHISGRTNDFVIRECQDNGGKVEIDTTDIDVSASTTDVKSCDRISAATDSYVVRECTDGSGNVGVDTTEIKVSASTTDIKTCDRLSAATDNYVLRECTDGSGKVGIDTTEVKVSASTTDVKSCDRISAITNDFQVKECAANGKAGISSTTINNSASTIDEKACTRISEVTNQFNITECTDGQGSVNVDTTSIDTTACTHNYNNTNDFKVTECTDGQGTTTIKSCKKFNVKSNDIVLEQCGNSGETKINSCKGISAITDNFIVEQCNSGKTHIHSCAEITLESKNITLTDGDCGSGQTTIEVNDLCLVGERKINVYGDETNVGLDCDDSKIATNTRVFGKGTLITTKATPTTYAGENNIETVAAQDIKENADRDINETAGRNINETATGNINESTTNGNINESAKNINNTASNDICDTAANNATFYGAVKTNVGINCNDTATAATTTVKGGKVIVDASTTDLGLTAKQDILESAERDITITANDDICETAGDEATFYGASLTRLGITCDGTTKTTQLEIGGEDVCVDANDRASMYGANKSDLGINCADNDRSTLTRVSGDTVNEGGNIVNTNAETSINETAPTINETATTSINEKAPTITESASTSISETAPNITETASQNITETATGKIVNTATGNVETTSVNAKITENAKTNIEETAGTDITETAGHDITETASHDINNTATNDIYVTAGNKLCEKGKDSYFYGTNSTTIGKGCDDTLSSNITYWRNAEPVCDNGVVGFSATTVDGALDEVYYRSQVSMTSTGNTTGIDVPVPETGTSIVRSGSTTYTIHQDSDGCDKTYDFVVDNTIVSMSAYTYPAESELLKKYTLWQYIGDDRVEIGEINVPKDHLIEDVQIVYGQVTGDPSSETGQTFVTCSTVSQDCHWYIKMVWHTYRSETGEHVDKVTYLPADDFVTDIDDKNDKADRGVKVDVWYDGKQNWVSADTTVKIMSYDGASARTFSKSAAVHTLTAYTLNSVSGDVKTANAATNWTYDPFDKKVTITAATDVNHLNRNRLKFVYGDVCSGPAQSYDPGAGTVNTTADTRITEVTIPRNLSNLGYTKLNIKYGTTSAEPTQGFDPGSTKDTCTVGTTDITIPSCVSHLNRHTIKFQSGSASTFTNQTYDPGKDCANSAETINIPTCVNHLNRHTIKFQSGSTSSFNNQTYDPGKDCANSAETINIPTAVSHLNRGKLTLTHCSDTVTFDPATDTSMTMNHYDLKYTHNGYTGTYNPCTSGTSFVAPHSALTINYGPTCNDTNAVNKTYDTSAAKTIVIPKTISDITGGAIKLNSCSGDCITVTGDICASGVVKATALYSTSDRNLKENINGINYEEYHKVSKVGLKSFNFKDDETKKKTYGIIAQDLQGVGLENIVHKDEQGNLSVDYTSFLILKIADLENTVKELMQEIKNLKGENKNN